MSSKKNNKMRKNSNHTEQSKQKMSWSAKRRGIKPPSRLGIPNTAEQRKKISETHKRLGLRPVPQYGNDNPSKRKEVREKISTVLTGKKLSEEHKKALSKNHRKTNSLEHRLKISIAHQKRVAEGLHPWWKGGITVLELKIRHSFKYRQWRSDVFTRDDFTCNGCNRRGGKLNAHHIEPFAFILEVNDVKTLKQAINCEELWNINNGITFCEKCHMKRHTKLEKVKDGST